MKSGEALTEKATADAAAIRTTAETAAADLTAQTEAARAAAAALTSAAKVHSEELLVIAREKADNLTTEVAANLNKAQSEAMTECERITSEAALVAAKKIADVDYRAGAVAETAEAKAENIRYGNCLTKF